jgi:hypothetical protein
VAERERKSEREKERKTERQKDRKRKKEERIGVSVRDRLGLCFGIDAAFALVADFQIDCVVNRNACTLQNRFF